MHIIRLSLPVFLLSTALGLSQAFAQDDGTGQSPQGVAQNEVRVSAIEEELRALRGKIEENEFQNRKLQESFDRLQKDIEFRFSDMAQHAAAAPLPSEQPAAPVETKKIVISHERKPLNTELPDNAVTATPDASAAGNTTAGNGVLALPEKEADNDEFSTPRDHYSHALRLFTQTQYAEAGASFENFTKKYPTDPLIGNAYYWLGDSYYRRHDYVTAADNFRQGFEALPQGPKAADNLLKLAMSLDALKRDKEACVVLQQVVVKFGKNSTTVTQKAQTEQARIGCQ